MCVVIEADEPRAPRYYGKDGVAETLRDWVQYAALNEPLLRVHEELLDEHAVAQIRRQAPADVAGATVAQPVVLGP